MPVNTELARPETEEDFEAMCCMLYQRVYNDSGLMRVGRSGQSQFGVDLLGADRRMPGGISVGVQCKHYQAKKFTIRTVTDDVSEADGAKLAIQHLTFATTAPASADVARQVHELSEQRRKQGKFTVSVEYWNTIQAHIRMHPEVGRAFIPGFPGGTLLNVRDDIVKVLAITEKLNADSAFGFDALKSGQTELAQQLRDLSSTMAPGARSLSPEPKGDEADPGVVVSLNFVRDRLREGKTRDARKLLDDLGDPNQLRDVFSRFRWYTNSAAIELLEGRTNEGAAGFLKAFEFARDDEKAHINRVHAYFLQEKYEAAEVACEEALARFAQSGPLWGMRLHIRAKLGKETEDGSTPLQVREQSDYLFSFARVQSAKGDQSTAVAMLRRCIELDGGSLDSRRAYLAEALTWAGVDSVSAFLGQMPDERRDAIDDALRRFEPLEETLATIQSMHLSEELATNITSCLVVLGKVERARSIAVQLLARHPDLEQLLRIRLVELADQKDAAGLKALTAGRLNSLAPSALALLAEASANLGDMQWNAEILEAASQRVGQDRRLRDVAPLAAVAAWRSGDHADALARAQEYVAANPNHILGRVIAAHLLDWSNRVKDAKREARACAELVPEGSVGADALQVADLLAGFDMHAEAARLYERFIKVPRADELTLKWLHCLVASDQRKKALLVIEKLPERDRNEQAVRHTEVNLAARMMDWPRMRDLLELDLTNGAIRPDVALGYGTALYRLNDRERLEKFAKSDPVLLNPRVEQEVEFAKLQVAAGLQQLGLQRLFRLFRQHPHNSRVAGILLAQVLVAGSVDALNPPGAAGPGTAVELRSGSESWWVAIDDAAAAKVESWPELVSPTTTVARELTDVKVGVRLQVTRGMLKTEAEVTRLVSLFSFVIDKAHALIASMPGSHGPVWSVRVIKEDGDVDIRALLQQARKRREQAESAFALYREHRIPLGMLAQLLGTDPVSLRLDWPSRETSLFVAIGSEDERQAALASIRRPGQRFVADLFTIAELLLHKTAEAVVTTVGRLLMPESQRQRLLEIMQDLPGAKKVASMQEHNGRLRMIELSDAYLRSRKRFLDSMLTFIDAHCDVVATAGPENQSKELRDLVRILDDPSADCLLLCLEKNAGLLSEDGGLRLFAVQAGVHMTTALQPVWMEALASGVLQHSTYADCIATKLQCNHDFVSVNGADLMDLAARKPDRVHPAVRAALETFRRPTLMFSSGVKVCADFLRFAVRRLPPATAGRYAVMTVSVLAHGRTVPIKDLERAFAVRLNVYGRNGRRLQPHVRRLFGGMLSRRLLRR